MVCGVHLNGRMLPSLKVLYCEPSETMDQAIMLFASPGLRRVVLNLAPRTGKPKLTMTRADLALSSVVICLTRTAPAIQELAFVGGTFVGVARVLLSLGLCKPTSLDIQGAIAASDNCLRTFALSALSMCWRAEETLDSLSIRGKVSLAGQDEADIQGTSLEQILQSFAFCRKLSAITLSIERLVAVSSSDISYLAPMWPLLTQLDLVGISTAEPPPSFSEIAHLLHVCPRLRVLKLPMLDAPLPDATEWPVLDSVLEVLVVAKQLHPQRQMPVCVDEGEIIAEIAGRLFPRLDEHESCEATKALPNGVNCRWRQIVDELAYRRYLRRERGLPDIFFVKAAAECQQCLSAERWLVGMTNDEGHEFRSIPVFLTFL